MTVGSRKKDTRLECNKWIDICVLPTFVIIIAKIILELIKEHLESLIDKEQGAALDPPVLTTLQSQVHCRAGYGV